MRFDLDVSQQMIATPMHTQISLTDQMADFSDLRIRATPQSSIVKTELMRMTKRDSFSAMQGEDLENFNKELEALNCDEEQDDDADHFNQIELNEEDSQQSNSPDLKKKKSSGNAAMIKKSLSIVTREFSNPLTNE